jgi:hypothetical protein
LADAGLTATRARIERRNPQRAPLLRTGVSYDEDSGDVGAPSLVVELRRFTIATYIVTKVRKEPSSDRTHRHIEGVCTQDGTHYTRAQVVSSIKSGNVWKTSADGYEAVIEPVTFCPAKNCYASPYIRTNPDSTKKDNLENLEAC